MPRARARRDETAAPAHPLITNVRTVVELETRSQSRTWEERLSERITGIIGTLRFVSIHVTCFAGWAAWNSLAPAALRFDPFPYGLLTLFVSLESTLIATFVLISQNRMSTVSLRRDHLNLQIDLLAEQEMTIVLRLLRRIAERLDVPREPETDEKADRLAEETDVYKLMRQLDRELPPSSDPKEKDRA